MDKNNPTTDLLNTLSRAMDGKMYGSIEVYLEDGQITQITQRIIKKIPKSKTVKNPAKKNNTTSRPRNNEVTLKFPA